MGHLQFRSSSLSSRILFVTKYCITLCPQRPLPINISISSTFLIPTNHTKPETWLKSLTLLCVSFPNPINEQVLLILSEMYFKSMIQVSPLSLPFL